ncbi:hypothetical protein D6779_04185 [Candidatus Parcubacteria bacterium]|nr:MAG: hypothetical protein D6779_04185 [Candidatus Parcubacteria bacterium]
MLRKQIIEDMEKLSHDKLRQVLSFIRYLLYKESPKPQKGSTGSVKDKSDPILSFIGGVSHGALASDIDIELYGELR